MPLPLNKIATDIKNDAFQSRIGDFDMQNKKNFTWHVKSVFWKTKRSVVSKICSYHEILISRIRILYLQTKGLFYMPKCDYSTKALFYKCKHGFVHRGDFLQRDINKAFSWKNIAWKHQVNLLFEDRDVCLTTS